MNNKLSGQKLLEPKEYEIIISKLSEIKSKILHIEGLKKELKIYTDKNLIYVDIYTPDYLLEVKISEKNRSELEKLCKNIDIECDQTELEEYKILVEKQPRIKEKIELLEKIKELSLIHI